MNLVAFCVFFLYGLLVVELGRILFKAPSLPIAAACAGVLALVVLLIFSDARRLRRRGR